MSSLINTSIKPFNAKAYHAKDEYGEFIDITEKSLNGHWSAFVFYPADFTFVCPTELSDLADHYEELKKPAFFIFPLLFTTFKRTLCDESVVHLTLRGKL